MRQFMLCTLEQRKDFSESFGTHPIEVAWATEAIFFITVEEIGEMKTGFVAKIQISIDGITWIDEGTCFDVISSEGQYFKRVSHFGGWLRLYIEIEGNYKINLTIHISLKE